MAAAILDRVHERGRFIHLDGPSGRTRHLNPEEALPENTKRLRISGIGGSEFPEPTRLYACIRIRIAYRDAFSPGRYANFGFYVLHDGLGFLPKYNDAN